MRIGEHLVLENEGNIYLLKSVRYYDNGVNSGIEEDLEYGTIGQFCERFEKFSKYQLLDFNIEFPISSNINPIRMSYNKDEYYYAEYNTFDDLIDVLLFLESPDQMFKSLKILFTESKKE